jgi:hypothetical protein
MGFHHSKPYHPQSQEQYKIILEDYIKFVAKHCKVSDEKNIPMSEFIAAFSTYLAKTDKYHDPTETAMSFIYGNPYSKNAVINSRNMIRMINNVDLSYGYYLNCIDMRYIIGLHLVKFPRP